MPGDLFGSWAQAPPWASHDRERDTASWRGAEEGAGEAGPGEGGAGRNPAARGSKRPDHVNPEEATELWAGGDGDRVPGQHGGGGVCFSLRRALRRRRHLPSPSPGVTALDAAGRPTGGAEGQAGSVRRGPGRSPRGRRAGGEKPGDLGLFLRWNQTDTWTC